MAAGRPRREVTGAAGGVESGEQTLCRGLFVAGGAVDLARTEEAGQALAFETEMEVARVEVVVLDGITGAQEDGVLQAAHTAHQFHLHGKRQAGGDAIGIDFVGIEAFRLQKDLVGALGGEAHDLIFDGRAVTRAHRLNVATIHGRLVQIRGDDLVGANVGMGNMADALGHRDALGHEGEGGRRGVAGLRLQYAVVDAATVDARRRAGLQARHRKGHRAQTLGEGVGRRIAGAAGGVALVTHVHPAPKESPRGENDLGCAQHQPRFEDDPRELIALHEQITDHALEQLQSGDVFEQAPHRAFVKAAVGLGAGSAHRRAFAGVERAELDARLVDGEGHDTAEGVDFFDQMPLADTTDGWIAGHLADGIEVLGEQKCAHAETGGRSSRFRPGVTTANDDDIKLILHGGIIRVSAGSWQFFSG